MYVYFARSIRGLHTARNEAVYPIIIKAIRDAGHRPQFDIKHDVPRGDDNDKFIYERDMFWLFNCDAMIAEVTTPSLGVGYEIAYADLNRQIPIMPMAKYSEDPVNTVSSMISGRFTVVYYESQADILVKVRSFLSSVASGK